MVRIVVSGAIGDASVPVALSQVYASSRWRARQSGPSAAPGIVPAPGSIASRVPPDGLPRPAARDSRARRSRQRDAFVPARDVGLEAERAHLRFEGDLGLGVAVDEEDKARKSCLAGSPAAREIGEPGEQLRLVGVGREAADRADLTAHLAILAVDPHARCARLKMRPERALALVANEQQGRG